MKKSRAFALLGAERPADVARLIGISPQAVNAWPEELSAAISDRVIAAVARRHLPPELIGEPADEPASHGMA